MFRGNYLGGKFTVVASRDRSGTWEARSPGDLDCLLGTVEYSFTSVDEAVFFAHKAQRSWRDLGVQQRLEVLRRVLEQISGREKSLIELLSVEAGQTTDEARREIAALLAYGEHGFKSPMSWSSVLSNGKQSSELNGALGYHDRPIGVVALISSFDLPAYGPFSQLFPALLSGNVVIWKPSEKTPAVSQALAECFDAAGIPPGVFGCLQGEREVGRRLAIHSQVSGVFFLGSSEVGIRIKQDTLQQPSKVVALQMGGKNAALVWDDTDLDFAVDTVLRSAYSWSGQRSHATSRVLVHRAVVDEFTELLHQKAKAFRIGHWSEGAFMGPLIDSSAVDRYMKFLGIAAREGADLVMRGKALELPKRGYYVTPTIACFPNPSLVGTKKSVFQQTELFAPAVAVLGVADLEEAIAQANETQYGLIGSVLTKSDGIFQKCLQEWDVGTLVRNRPTTDLLWQFPAIGLKKSGNHFPGGLMSALYSTVPVVAVENGTLKDI